jgi:hypothetical protein
MPADSTIAAHYSHMAASAALRSQGGFAHNVVLKIEMEVRAAIFISILRKSR